MCDPNSLMRLGALTRLDPVYRLRVAVVSPGHCRSARWSSGAEDGPVRSKSASNPDYVLSVTLPALTPASCFISAVKPKAVSVIAILKKL